MINNLKCRVYFLLSGFSDCIFGVCWQCIRFIKISENAVDAQYVRTFYCPGWFFPGPISGSRPETRLLPTSNLLEKTPLLEWHIHLDDSRRSAATCTETRGVNGACGSSLASKSVALRSKHGVQKRGDRVDLSFHDSSHVLFEVWQ